MQKVQAIVEVQAMSGEIDDVTYRMALSGIKTVMSKLSKEMELLNRELSFLEIEIEEKPTVPANEEQKPTIVVAPTEQLSSSNEQVETSASTNASSTNVPEVKLEDKKETEEKSSSFQLNNTFDLEFIKKIGGVVPGTPGAPSEGKLNKDAKDYEEPIHVKVDG
jgi:hypothetical protein